MPRPSRIRLRIPILLILFFAPLSFADPILDRALEGVACPSGLRKIAPNPTESAGAKKEQFALPDLLALHPEVRSSLEAILDKPVVSDPSATGFKKARQDVTAAALLDYHSKEINDPERPRVALTVAGHWIGASAQYVARHPTWNAEQKGMVLQALGRLIMERTKSGWSMRTFRLSDGHIVASGALHRIVILNKPGAPVYRGAFLPPDDPAVFYQSWNPEPTETNGLTPIQ